MGSSRLPGKIMKELNGKPILQHIVDFLKHSKMIEKIVIATTDLQEDDVVDSFSKKLEIDCFRGSSKNVLERFYKCAKKYNANLIIRLTADNPLINPKIIDDLINLCINYHCDYVSNCLHPTYPYGYSTCEIFTFSTLSKLYETQKDHNSIEHVTSFIRENPNLFNIRELKAPENLSRPNWRLSVDTIEDYTKMQKIFSSLYRENSFIDYPSLVQFLDQNKQIIKSDPNNN
jgi:spore coat polysaccharide biosynthesis protein SpsF (cytidylyltransferase family)